MTQMADPRDNQRSRYPPPDGHNQGGYYAQHSPERPPHRDERSPYPPPPQDSARQQGQYPPHDPRASSQYPPPHQWAPQQHGAYPPPPSGHHYPDPQQGQYPYPPRQDLGQPPPQPMQPDAYRLPPPYPPPHGYYAQPQYAPPPAPAPRQRTAIACKYCRKRKIRCSGYDSSPDGRCQNCVRFNQTCLFHPVSSQAAFVPASAVYGPNARAPGAGQNQDGRPGPNGYSREGEQPMLYGAHGQPLGPAGPSGQPQYNYPPLPQGYAAQPYQYSHGSQYPPPGTPYDSHGQAPPQHGERVTSYEYPDPSNATPTSPTNSTMSYTYPSNRYTNGNHSVKGNNSPPAGLTPQSAHSFHSPHIGPIRDDGKTPPPPHQPGSAGSSSNGRSGMKVHEMLGNHHGSVHEQRGRNDNEMLNKLEGKKPSI